MSAVGVVIPVGPGRQQNLVRVLECLSDQTVAPAAVVVVEDGDVLDGDVIVAPRLPRERTLHVKAPKHEPGDEQPRNVGVRLMRAGWPDVTHVWFLDSDVIVGDFCLELLLEALHEGPQDRIVVAPYDWLPPGSRDAQPSLYNDPRWPTFDLYPPDEVRFHDLAAGLACFSGNLMWPISEFVRVGGFWSELHHGRCEDGELGLRATAMGVGISFQASARGWHLWHPVDYATVVARNARDVPLLNARHPWVQESGVAMVDRDGKAFDVCCRRCGHPIPTNQWWHHAEECGVAPCIPYPAVGA